MSSSVGPVANGIPTANPNLAWGEAKHPGNRFANQFGVLGYVALFAVLAGLAFITLNVLDRTDDTHVAPLSSRFIAAAKASAPTIGPLEIAATPSAVEFTPVDASETSVAGLPTFTAAYETPADGIVTVSEVAAPDQLWLDSVTGKRVVTGTRAINSDSWSLGTSADKGVTSVVRGRVGDPFVIVVTGKNEQVVTQLAASLAPVSSLK